MSLYSLMREKFKKDNNEDTDNSPSNTDVSILIMFAGVAIAFSLISNRYLQLSKTDRNLANSDTSPTPTRVFYPEGFEVSPNPSVTPNLTPHPFDPNRTTKGKVAFVKDGDIFSVNADRTSMEQLTNDEFRKFGIRVSPDSKKIVYSFYPKDPEKRTNEGYYVGFNSGVGVVDTESKKTTVLVPYGNIQNHYAGWTPDSRYVYVWVGNGKAAKLLDAADGKTIFEITSDTGEEQVSPIVWVSSKNKISYVSKGSVYLSNIDGSDNVKIADGAEALRQVHEGPNIPQPPLWSPEGRFAAYYKDSYLTVFDSENNSETVIGTAVEEEMFGGNYPQTYLLSYDGNQPKGFIYETGESSGIFKVDFASKEKELVYKFSQSAVISPDNKKIFALTNEPYTGSPVGFYDIDAKELKTCGSDFRHEYYWWAGGMGYSKPLNTWNSEGSAIIGRGDYSSSTPGLKVMLTDCTQYDLVLGNNIGDMVWFP